MVSPDCKDLDLRTNAENAEDHDKISLWFQQCPMFDEKDKKYGDMTNAKYGVFEKTAALVCNGICHVEVQIGNKLYGAVKHQKVHCHDVRNINIDVFHTYPWKMCVLDEDKLDVKAFKNYIGSQANVPYDAFRATLSPLLRYFPDTLSVLKKDYAGKKGLFCSEYIMEAILKSYTPCNIDHITSANVDPGRLLEEVQRLELVKADHAIPAVCLRDSQV
jgi:hypothetical protein